MPVFDYKTLVMKFNTSTLINISKICSYTPKNFKLELNIYIFIDFSKSINFKTDFDRRERERDSDRERYFSW